MFKLASNVAQRGVIEIAAYAADVDQTFLVWLRKQQCNDAAAAALGVGVANYDELVRWSPLHLYPVAAAAVPIQAVDAFADDAFQPPGKRLRIHVLAMSDLVRALAQ